jgi:hypothetical protein
MVFLQCIPLPVNEKKAQTEKKKKECEFEKKKRAKF